MTNAMGVYRAISNTTAAAAHDHQLLSVLISCPDERCRRRSVALFGQPTGHLDLQWEWHGPLSDDVDADERLPGYVRERHFPLFESRRSASLRQAAGS